jgi:protein TonB
MFRWQRQINKEWSGAMRRTWVIPNSHSPFDTLLVATFFASLFLHSGALYAAHRWGDCLCRLGKVVCPKICYESEARIDLELKPPPAPQPQPKPKPEVVAPVRPDKPLAAPKRGWVVLPDEALQPRTEPPKEMTARLPSLPEDVVVKASEASAPVMATPEIFGRASELSAGPPGEYGLGGTGKATGVGPFGPAVDGSGTERKTVSAPPPKPEPVAKPKGPSRSPKVLNWTDPPYPEQARQQGIEGTVVLKLTVQENGAPNNVRVSKSSGHAALDEAAVAHVRRARFSPALKNGEETAMAITFRVKFHLVNA